MATTERRSIGYMLTQIALGLYFFVTGIWTLQGGNGNEIAAAVKSVTGGIWRYFSAGIQCCR